MAGGSSSGCTNRRRSTDPPAVTCRRARPEPASPAARAISRSPIRTASRSARPICAARSGWRASSSPTARAPAGSSTSWPRLQGRCPERRATLSALPATRTTTRPRRWPRYAELFEADPAALEVPDRRHEDLQRSATDNFQVGLEKGTHSERGICRRSPRATCAAAFDLPDPASVEKLEATRFEPSRTPGRLIVPRELAGASNPCGSRTCCERLDFTACRPSTPRSTRPATLLLVWGYRLIKASAEQPTNGSCFPRSCVSIVFLVCFLPIMRPCATRPGRGTSLFHGPPTVRVVYLTMLVTHVVLAAIVPVLAGVTIYWAMATAVPAIAAGRMDVSHLAVRVHHGRHDLLDALSSLPRLPAEIYNAEPALPARDRRMTSTAYEISHEILPRNPPLTSLADRRSHRWPCDVLADLAGGAASACPGCKTRWPPTTVRAATWSPATSGASCS